MKSPDHGKWIVQDWKDGRIVLQSDDFTHDVALVITGDFESYDFKMDYANALANWMNEKLENSECECPCYNCVRDKMEKENSIVVNLTINPNNTFENDTHVFFWGSVFSNWAKGKFIHKGVQYNCSEQTMMALKAKLFNDEKTYAEIMKTSDPRKQKALGRAINGYNEEKWAAVRFDLAVEYLYDKFSQIEDFKKQLLATGDKIIAESSATDKVWGIGFHIADPNIHDQSKWGQNLLGKALMEVRKRIREDEAKIYE